jgi:hypothetical protein
MKVVIRSPSLPLLVLWIVLDLPVSKTRWKAGHVPEGKRNGEQRADALSPQR